MRTQRTLESLLTIPIVYFVFLRWIVFSTSISGPEHGTPKNGTTNEMRRNRRGPRRLACVCVRKVLIHVVFKVAVRWKITCTLYPLSKRPLARAHTHKPTADSLSMNEHLVYLLTYSHYDARNDYFIISFAASPRILRMFFFPLKHSQPTNRMRFWLAAFAPSIECIEKCNFRLNRNRCQRQPQSSVCNAAFWQQKTGKFRKLNSPMVFWFVLFHLSSFIRNTKYGWKIVWPTRT